MSGGNGCDGGCEEVCALESTLPGEVEGWRDVGKDVGDGKVVSALESTVPGGGAVGAAGTELTPSSTRIVPKSPAAGCSSTTTGCVSAGAVAGGSAAAILRRYLECRSTSVER